MSKHEPARLRTYLQAHGAHMDKLRVEGFVGADTLDFSPGQGGYYNLDGLISCLGRIVIQVGKTLATRTAADDPLVQTVTYAYNATVQGHGNILRHDNAHAHDGHDNEHHRHEYDWRTGDELPGSPKCVGEEGWPLLSEFIREVADWYHAHREELPEPDAFADLEAARTSRPPPAAT